MTLRLSTGLRDKLLGVATDLMSNGGFGSDTAGWTASSSTLDSTAVGQTDNGLEITESGGVNEGDAFQDRTTIVGRMYKLTAYFQKGTATGGKILVGTTSNNVEIFESAQFTDVAFDQKTIIFIATETTTRITLRSDDTSNGTISYFDTVVLEEILDGFKEIMRNCNINFYSGAQPASADDVATGTLLATISDNSGAGGLDFGESDGGVISKDLAQIWNGDAGATGTAGWFRCYQDGDDPSAANIVKARFDGAIAVSGGELNMSSTSVVSGAKQTISIFTYTQPGS